MNDDPLPLFRREVMSGDRLQGHLAMSLPYSWHLIGSLLTLGAVGSLLFLATFSYDRTERVLGVIMPDSGLAEIAASRAGTVTAVYVRLGSEVVRGAPAIEITAPESASSGRSVSSELMTTLTSQSRELAIEQREIGESLDAEQARLSERIKGLSAEIEEIGRQIAFQHRRVDSAKAELESILDVAAGGYISKRDIRLREDTLLALEQELSRLQQTLGARRSERKETQKSLDRAVAEARARAAEYARSRAALDERAIGTASSGRILLRTPVGGTVSSVRARLGQAVDAQTSLILITPARAVMTVELFVPSSAIGFVRKNQTVRVAVDAFPVSQFGTISARVTSVAMAAGAPAATGEARQPIYQVRAEIATPFVGSGQNRRPLLPGMTLSAQIVTGRETFLARLLAPVGQKAKR